MAAAYGVGRELVGEGQQELGGMIPISARRTMAEQGSLPKAALRFWSLVLCAITLVLASPAVLRAQTFQTIAPLSFTKVFAGADPLPQLITVASTDPTSTIAFTATAVNSAGNNWLSVSGGGTFNPGTTPQAITVTVKPGATMGAGTYTAQINVKSTDGKQSLVVPVSLIVNPASSASFAESGGALTFSMVVKGNAPPSQSIQIANVGTGSINWTASATTADGGKWLTPSKPNGIAPSTLSVGVVPTNLPFGGAIAGTFVGEVVLATSGDSVTIPVTVTVGTSVFEQVNALSFNMTYGGAAPLPQVLTVASTDLPFGFTASAANPGGSGLVSVSGGGTFNPGTTPQAITVSINPATNQPVGTYTSEVIVRSTDGAESMVVPVTLTVQPSTAPYFDQLPGELSFSLATKGSAPPTQPVAIRNGGSGTLNWTASAITSDGGNWLTLSATNGSAPSTLSVGIDPSSLPGQNIQPGTFTGQILLQIGEERATIPVTVTVGTSVFEQVNALSFNMTYGGAAPLPQVLTVASTDLPFGFTASAANPGGSGLVSVSGGGTFNPGTTPQAITVSINPATNQPVGTYTSEVIVRSTDGAESMVVPVTLTVQPSTAPYFDTTQGAFTFSMTPSGTTPPGQALPIRNTGSSILNWSVSATTADGGNWLSLSPGQGTAPSTSLVSVDPANLPHDGMLPGAFTGLVTLQTPSGNVTVPVTYTVGNSVFQQVPALVFNKAYGAGSPLTQTFTIASTSSSLAFSATAVTSSEQNWLKITGGGTFNPASTPQIITATVQPDATQPLGTYTAEIIVKTTDDAEPMVIPVTLTIGSTTQAAATPTFSPAGGTYASAQNVTITTATTDAAIYYTTDGSQPTIKSASYTGPVKVTASGTLNAIAIASGYTQSGVGSATYTITGGQCVVIDNSAGFTGTGLSLNGGASISGKLLQLTDGGFDEARSAFSSNRVPIDSFITDFTFQLLDAYAEGFTFTIQGDSPQSVGASGGGLGYQGIPYSAAVKIDLFDTAGEGYDSTGIYLNGAAPTVPSIDLGPSGIDIHDGHVFAAHIAYVNGVYQGSITDTVTGVSASVALQGYVTNPGEMAFVGFTGGTSSEGSATQNILTWKYQGGSACGH